MSNAFHVLKELQTFAAACVALIAAAIAYASQRYAADTQAKTARESARLQIITQREKEKQDRLISRIVFSARLFSCNQKAINELSVLKIQMQAIERKAGEDGIIVLSQYSMWNGVMAFLKLSEIYDFEAMFDKGFAISDQGMQQAFIDTTSTLRRWDIGFALIMETSSRSESIDRKTLEIVINQIENTMVTLGKISVRLKETLKVLQVQVDDTVRTNEDGATQHDPSGTANPR